jgi:hypothetical protein
VSQWKRRRLVAVSKLLTRGKKNKGKEDSKTKEAELIRQIGQLRIEVEWL